MYFFLWILPVWFSNDIMNDHVITVGNTVTLTLPPPGQPPARGWGQTSDVCHQASASVSGPSLGLASVRKLEAGCVSPTLASREWGYPLSSALASGHTYHITFPLIRMSGPWNIFSEGGYCMLSYFAFCCFEYIFAVPSNNANDQSYW